MQIVDANRLALTFKRGWPVVEGKPVLLTSVLQSLLDDLGEPFIRAMNDRLSGDITFKKAFSIGFDERQQILAQDKAIETAKRDATSARQAADAALVDLRQRLDASEGEAGKA